MKSATISSGINNEVIMGFAAGVAEGATGCTGAGSYLDFAKEHGFNHVEVVDWSSGAGDWCFIVSKNGYEWYLLYQTNNYPHPGFSHQIVEDTGFFGSADEALTEICESWGYV